MDANPQVARLPGKDLQLLLDRQLSPASLRHFHSLCRDLLGQWWPEILWVVFETPPIHGLGVLDPLARWCPHRPSPLWDSLLWGPPLHGLPLRGWSTAP